MAFNLLLKNWNSLTNFNLKVLIELFISIARILKKG